jgi:hypothetical protein
MTKTRIDMLGGVDTIEVNYDEGKVMISFINHNRYLVTARLLPGEALKIANDLIDNVRLAEEQEARHPPP